jgi:hypothetical protein
MGYLRGRDARVRKAALLLLSLAFLSNSSANAVPRDFTLVTNQSSITLSGTVTTSLGTAPIQQQGAGGLTASYSGTIKTDRAPNAISFLAGSMVDANVTGDWRPLADAADGTSPADYGARVSYLGGFAVVNFAGRNLVAGLVGPATTINGSGQFDLGTTSVEFLSGDLAYRGPAGIGSGTSTLANQTGPLSGTGSLGSATQSGQTTETLTFPVNATFNFNPDASTSVSLTLTGQLVATSTFAAGLPGDYNENGAVDAADYVVWRDNLGSGTSLPNDDTAGVDQEDYMRWKAHFGQPAGSGAGTGAAVPEGSTLAWLCVWVAAVACRRSAR